MAALGLPCWLSGKHGGFDPWVGKIPWRRKWQLTPVYLPGKSHGQRSLAGHRSWDCKRVGHDLVTEQQRLQLCLPTPTQQGPEAPRPASPICDPAVRQVARCRPGPRPGAQVALLCTLRAHTSAHPSLTHSLTHKSLLNTFPVYKAERLAPHATLCQVLFSLGEGSGQNHNPLAPFYMPLGT